MIMMQTISLYWRLTHNVKLNSAHVSILMPAKNKQQKSEEIPTNINLAPLKKHLKPIDIKWSDEDEKLFFELLGHMDDTEEQELVLDLKESYLQEIIHWVAIKRFNSPTCFELFEGEILQTERIELEVGDIIAVNTRYGFSLGVILTLNSIDADCILLDGLYENNKEVLPEKSLINVSRLCLLPPEYAEEDSVFQILH